MQVDFIIAGAQKSGTTALYYFLGKNPSISMALQKEVHFFDNESVYGKSGVDYDIYHRFFQSNNGAMLAGESTPIYLYWQPAVKRIFDYNHAMKWVVILRNPIFRAYSQWNMSRLRGVENLSFIEALHAEPERINASLPLQNREHSYIDRGRYCEQLERVFSLFPREQVIVIKHDDFRRDTCLVLDRICAFLGVPALAEIQPREVHSLDYEEPLRYEDWHYLMGVFEPEITKVEKLLGWDCSDWRKNPFV